MAANLTPEQKAGENIDRMLSASGWDVQNMSEINFAGRMGVAVREYQTDAGFADYVLFIDRKPVGVIEARREEEEQHEWPRINLEKLDKFFRPKIKSL